VLVTNDDGYRATGIRVLVRAWSAKPGVEVVTVAPDRERSATGHAITVHEPLRVEEVSIPGAQKAFAVSGTPSDCVKLATDALWDELPDVILSGINSGPNLGTDVLYSGTVSAAAEGAILGIPSLALSLDDIDEEAGYIYVAEFAWDLTRILLSESIPAQSLLNINFPPLEGVQGVRLTRLGVRKYRDIFEKRTDPRGRLYYWLAGDTVDEDESSETDIGALAAGYISITPMRLDLTDDRLLATMRSWRMPLAEKSENS